MFLKGLFSLSSMLDKKKWTNIYEDKWYEKHNAQQKSSHLKRSSNLHTIFYLTLLQEPMVLFPAKKPFCFVLLKTLIINFFFF